MRFFCLSSLPHMWVTRLEFEVIILPIWRKVTPVSLANFLAWINVASSLPIAWLLPGVNFNRCSIVWYLVIYSSFLNNACPNYAIILLHSLLFAWNLNQSGLSGRARVWNWRREDDLGSYSPAMWDTTISYMSYT